MCNDNDLPILQPITTAVRQIDESLLDIKPKQPRRHLYEISNNYGDAMDMLDEAMEAGTPEAEAAADNAMTAVEEEFDDKVEAIGCMIRNEEADLKACQDEVNRLQSRCKTAKSRIDWYKRYLLNAFLVAKKTKIKTIRVTVAIANCPPSVAVINDDLVPESFKRHIPEQWDVDKKKALDHFKETGEELPGISVTSDRKTVRIR